VDTWGIQKLDEPVTGQSNYKCK